MNLKHILSSLILICFLISTYAIYQSHKDRIEGNKARQQNELQRISLLLEEKIKSYEFGLQGLAGIYILTEFRPSDKKLKTYAQYRNYFSNFEGSLGFGFIRLIKAKNIDKYILSVKNEYPDFEIKTLSAKLPNQDFYIIESIEPELKNKKAQGLDVATEQNRFEAANQSYIENKVIITKSIQLIQADGKKEGFLIFKPIFDKNTFKGWVYTPILKENILLYLKERTNLTIDLSVESPLIQNKDILNAEINVFGKNWRLSTKLNKESILNEYLISTLVFAITIIGFILLFIISNQLIKSSNNTKTELSSKTAWQSAILNSTNLSIISTDKNGIITTFNSAAEDILGYKADQLIQKQNPSLFHDKEEIVLATKKLNDDFNIELSPGFSTFIYRADKYKKPDTQKWTYISANNERIPVNLTVTSILNSEQEILGYLGVAEDLRPKMKAEHEKNSLLKVLNESTILCTYDINGNFIDVNDKFTEITGFSKNLLIGQSYSSIETDKQSINNLNLIWVQLKQGISWNGEYKSKDINGVEYWLYSIITPIKTINGDIDRMISISYDITARKKAELKMIQSSKMASLGEMAGNVAHEINNPLAIINGKVAILKRYCETNKMDPEKMLKSFFVIEQTVERIAKIVKGLRSFCHDSEKEGVRNSQLNSILNEIFNLSEERFKTNSVDLKLEVENNLSLDCRPVQLSQVIINLLNNSYDAIQGKSKKWIRLSAKSIDKNIRIRIQDSGDGIPDDVVSKLMEPFFTTKEIGKGTGLGLSLSKGIIEEHGGKLYYELFEGHTSFVLDLPIKAPDHIFVRNAA